MAAAQDATPEDVLKIYESAQACILPGKTGGIRISANQRGEVTRVTRWIGIRYVTPFNDAGMRVGETKKVAKEAVSSPEDALAFSVNTYVGYVPEWARQPWVPAPPLDQKARLKAEIMALWPELDRLEKLARELHEKNHKEKLSGKGAEERIKKGTVQLVKAVKGTVGVAGLSPAGIRRVFMFHSRFGCFTQTGRGSAQFESHRMSDVEIALMQEGMSLSALIHEAHLWAAATQKTFGMGTFLQYSSQFPLIVGLLTEEHVEEAQKICLVADVMEA